MKLFKKHNLETKNNVTVFTRDDSKQILSHFIDFWNCSKDIKEDLLPELNSVVNGEIEFNDIGADVVGLAYIEYNTTKLIGSELGHYDFELPTEDFKDLLMEWASILESNGR